MGYSCQHPSLQTADPAYYGELKRRAQYNRDHPTDAERLLWFTLSSISGAKFRRQHVLGTCIVDFVCLRKRLIIEVDGGYHFTEDQVLNDAYRTDYLQRMGYEVVRFTNDDVLNHLDYVLSEIQNLITTINSAPTLH